MREQRCSARTPDYASPIADRTQPIDDDFCATIAELQDDLQLYFQRRGADTMEAEDLAQDVALTAYEHLERFDGDKALVPWVFGIAHNQLRMWYRQKHHYSLPVEALDDDTCVIPDFRAERDFHCADARYAFDLILSRLSRQDTHLLICNGVLGLTAQEYSQLVGMPAANVAKRLSRAKERFRLQAARACARGNRGQRSSA